MASKQIGQRHVALQPGKQVVLFYFYPRQCPAPAAQLVPQFAGQLFLFEQNAAAAEPFLLRDDLMRRGAGWRARSGIHRSAVGVGHEFQSPISSPSSKVLTDGSDVKTQGEYSAASPSPFPRTRRKRLTCEYE